MRRSAAYAWLLAASLLAALAIGATAEWDHRHPGPSTQQQWTSLWYCEHLHERCDQPKPWHAGWHRREHYYTLGFAGALTLASLSGIASYGRRRLQPIGHY